MALLDSLRELGNRALVVGGDALGSYVASRLDVAASNAAELRRDNPTASPSELAALATRRYSTLAAGVGGAVGGVMLAPGGSAVGRFLMIAGDIVVNSLIGIDVVLTTAACHGHTPADAAQAREWLVDALTGEEETTHHVTAPLPFRPEERMSALSSVPMPAALSMKGQLPVRVLLLSLPDAEDDAPLRDWKVWLPTLTGVAAGAWVDRSAVEKIGARAERYFGPVDEKERAAMAQRVDELERILDSTAP